MTQPHEAEAERPGTGLVLAAAVVQARAAGLDRVDAMALLAHVTGQTRAWLIAHDDATMSAEQAQAFATLCRRRAAGEPVAYLVGQREFHGLTLQVTPDVLVPRPDTETLVDWALAVLAGPLAHLSAPRVLDLGTGSGAIALALRHRHPTARLTAVDASAAALAVARANGQHLGLAVDWRLGDWWQPVAGQTFDLVLSNPPYIAGNDPHLVALRHEPLSALTPGGDGLSAFRQIIAGAAQGLTPAGWLLFEHGHDQAMPVQRLLREAGFVAVAQRQDLAGVERCSGGCRADHTATPG